MAAPHEWLSGFRYPPTCRGVDLVVQGVEIFVGGGVELRRGERVEKLESKKKVSSFEKSVILGKNCEKWAKFRKNRGIFGKIGRGGVDVRASGNPDH